MTIDDLQDDLQACFREYPIGPAECRGLMKIVVSVLEASGFRRTLQAQGKQRLTRCLAFDPTVDSLSCLDATREVIAEESTRARDRQSSADTATSLTNAARPSETGVEHKPAAHSDAESCVTVPSVAPEMQHSDEIVKPLGTRKETTAAQPSAGQEGPAVGTEPHSSTTESQLGGPEMLPDPSPSESAVPAVQSQSRADPTAGRAPIAAVADSVMPEQLKARIRADADSAVDMLLDDMLDDVVVEMNRLEQAQVPVDRQESGPVAAGASRGPVVADLTPILRRLADLAREEEELVAKYKSRQPTQTSALATTMFSADAEGGSSREIGMAPKPDAATATAFVDARFGLAARHRDAQLTISAFKAWQSEAADAPRLAAITFSLTTLKIKLMLPRWQRLASTEASARALSQHHRGKRCLELMRQSTTESRNARISESHHADVQLCRALLRWHSHVQEQQLRDRDQYASLARKVRKNLMHRSWTSWRDAENRLLALVHSRRSLALLSLRRWNRAVGAMQMWRRRWETIVRRVAFVSWQQFCAQSSLNSTKLQVAQSHKVYSSTLLHWATWRQAATEEGRLRRVGDAIETSATERALRFGIAALRCGALLNRHCAVLAKRQRKTVWVAWLNEHKLLRHNKNRAFESWKVFVGMARLETWLAHVRYTIHGRWVVVDCFYEWKRRSTVWVQGRKLLSASNAAVKSRCLHKWIVAFETRSVANAGLEASAVKTQPTTADASATTDTDEQASGISDAASASLDGRQTAGVDALIAERVAEVKAELGSQYEALQDALAAQQRGLLSDIKTDVGALNHRLAALGLMSPATIEMLQQSGHPGTQGGDQAQPAQAAPVAAPSVPAANAGQQHVPCQSKDRSEQEAALAAKIEEMDAARKSAEEQVAAAKAREDNSAREADAKLAAANAARVAAEEQQAAAVQAREEEAVRAAAAATAAAAKIAEAEAARVAAEEAQAAADRQKEEEVAAVRQQAALDAAQAEETARTAAEEQKAALEAEADRVRKEEAAARRAEEAAVRARTEAGRVLDEERAAVAQAERAAFQAEEQERIVAREAADQEEPAHRMAQAPSAFNDGIGQASASLSPELDEPLLRRDAQRPDTSGIEGAADTSGRMMMPAADAEERRVVVQTSATVKPLGDDVSALQLRKEQLRKEHLAQQARGQRGQAQLSAASDSDDWSSRPSIGGGSHRHGRRAGFADDREPLFEATAASLDPVADGAGEAGAQEPRQQTETTTVAPVVSPEPVQGREELTEATTEHAVREPEKLHDDTNRDADTAEQPRALTRHTPAEHEMPEDRETEPPAAVSPSAAVAEAAEEASVEEAVVDTPPKGVGEAGTLTQPASTSPASETGEEEQTASTSPIPETTEEDRETRLKFDELDTDNSGALDVNELAQLIKELLDTEGDEATKKKTGAKQVKTNTSRH